MHELIIISQLFAVAAIYLIIFYLFHYSWNDQWTEYEFHVVQGYKYFQNLLIQRETTEILR